MLIKTFMTHILQFFILRLQLLPTAEVFQSQTFGYDRRWKLRLRSNTTCYNYLINLTTTFGFLTKNGAKLMIAVHIIVRWIYKKAEISFSLNLLSSVMPTLTSLINRHARLFFARKKYLILPADFHVID